MKNILCLLRKCDWRGLMLLPTENAMLQFFRYIFVGACAFFVDFSSYCILEAVGLHYLLAGVFAFLISFIFNFCISRVLIFKSAASEKATAQELTGVALISLVGLGLTELLLFVGTDLLEMDFRISKVVSSILVLFWNYTARKLFVYRAPTKK